MTGCRQPSFTATFDAPLIWRKGNSLRFLMVQVTAPRLEAAGPRPPLDLALVIDASGSMGGDRIEAARQAAIGIAEGLRDCDRLSLVSFSTDVQTHLDGVAMDAPGRRQAAEQLSKLEVRHCTDLSGGWLRGAECVARQMAEQPGRQSRVLLLSDGRANRGILDPGQLGLHARELCERGLLSSTVGIGDGYQTTQLMAIAEQGGGRLHDAELPGELVEVVLGELRELAETVVENVVVSLAFPPGLRPEFLNGSASRMEGEALSVSLGSLLSGGRREAVFRLRLPAGDAGSRLPFRVTLGWRQPGQLEVETAEPLALDLTYAGGRDCSAQPRRPELVERIAQLWQARIVQDAVQMNREARFAEVRHYVESEAQEFRWFCRNSPECGRLIDELKGLLETIGQAWNERDRKEVELAQYYGSSLRQDHRSRVRPHWSHYSKPSSAGDGS